MFATADRDTQAPSHASRLAAMLAIAALSLALTGCQASRPHAASQTDIPSETNAELIEYISNQPFVAAEPAYRAVYILSTGDIYDGGFDELTGEMKSSKLVRGEWGYDATTYLDRSDIGFMVARACEIRSGLNWNLTGLGRYAYRELAFRNIAHPAGETTLISGGEFLGLMARAEEYLHKVGRAPGEEAELGPEPAK